MKFSEKYFEFALNRELYNHFKNIYIPSQGMEAKLGYDAMIKCYNNWVKIGYVRSKKIKLLFIQHKIPEKSYNTGNKYYLGSCGSQLSNLIYPNKWVGPRAFRFKLYRKKNFRQHRKLEKLSNSKFCLAVYASPRFDDVIELKFHMSNDEVIKHTAFFDAKNLVPILKSVGNHYVYYDEDINSYHKVCSEPESMLEDNLSFDNVLEELKNIEYVDLGTLLLWFINYNEWLDHSDWEKAKNKILKQLDSEEDLIGSDVDVREVVSTLVSDIIGNRKDISVIVDMLDE